MRLTSYVYYSQKEYSTRDDLGHHLRGVKVLCLWYVAWTKWHEKILTLYSQRQIHYQKQLVWTCKNVQNMQAARWQAQARGRSGIHYGVPTSSSPGGAIRP